MSEEKQKKSSLRPRNIFIFGNSSQVSEFEMMLSPRFNMGQGQLVREVKSPRDADVLLIFGSINHKSASVLKRVYDQMNFPKWVISVGGNPVKGSYSVVEDLESILPVDLYLNRLSPSPVDLWDAIGELS